MNACLVPSSLSQAEVESLEHFLFRKPCDYSFFCIFFDITFLVLILFTIFAESNPFSMNYPLLSEYIESIKSAEDNFN